jgi:hypothetical protein
MEKYGEVFVEIDKAKKKHAVAIADAGRDGETRYLGSGLSRSWRASARRYASATKLDRRVMG